MIELRSYQKRILEEFKHLGAIGLFMGTGSGKTITSLSKACELPIKNILIVSPHSVLEQWKNTIDTHFSDRFSVFPLNKRDTAKAKNEQLKKFPKSVHNVIIVNFDILFKLTTLLDIVDDEFLIIIDESHKIKSVGTRKNPVKVTEAALKLGELTDFKIILTATPTQGSFGGYIEYYPQLKFLGYLNEGYETFRNKYAIESDIWIPGRRYPVKQIVGYINKDEIDNLLKMCCVRYNPKYGDYEPQFIKVDIERPGSYPKTSYDKVYKDIFLDNVARKRIGLKTLCTGTIMGFNGWDERLQYDDNKNKIEWLEDFLSGTDETVVVYYQYNVELDKLKKLMDKLGKKYIEVNGKTKDKYSLVNNTDYDVMLGQFQAASESLDGLQYKSHLQVFFTIPESSQTYKQAIGRIDRDGQTKVPTNYFLVTAGTIESTIYEMIEKKIEFNEETLNKLLLEEEK